MSHSELRVLPPEFKIGLQAAPIRSVDIYNLMCRTLSVQPLPNNGSWSRVEYLLRAGGHRALPPPLWLLLVALMVTPTTMLVSASA